MANLSPLDYPKDLLSNTGGASELNFNSILLQRYIKEIIPSITIPGDDEQHGSSVVNDVTLLQALSRRIHYGKFVAESKYRDTPEKYQALVDADDDEGVMALLTNNDVEKKLLRRVRLKAANYGREPMDLFVNNEDQQSDDIATTTTASSSDDAERRMVAVAAATAVMVALESWDRTRQRSYNKDDGSKVDPRVIEAIYRDILIPLTKDVEVAYLFRRCGKEPPKKYLGEKVD
jgi:chorismate mutase